MKMPSWGSENNLVAFLPNLVRLEFSQIDVEYLTCLGNLPHLRKLSLDRLQILDCIIEGGVVSRASMELVSSALLIAEELSFFPSLVELNLSELPRLKRWCCRSGLGDNNQLLVYTSSSNRTPLLLPQLKKLSIHMRTMLQCPYLEELYLEKFSKQLQIITPTEESGVR
ncbi:Internalin-I [Bienertia sinuspersici]